MLQLNFTFPNSAPAMAINPLIVKIANDFSLKTAIGEMKAFSWLSKFNEETLKHF
jgi:hypothetical protein